MLALCTALPLVFALGDAAELRSGGHHYKFRRKRTGSADWSYAEPHEWKESYPACGDAVQSPINITGVTFKHYSQDQGYDDLQLPGRDWGSKNRSRPVILKSYKDGTGARQNLSHLVTYRPTKSLYLENTGRFMQVVGSFGNFTESGVDYIAQSIQFHAPSEHAFNGRHFPAELQVVHRAEGPEPEGRILILVVVIDTSPGAKSNEFLHRLGFDMVNLPRHAGNKTRIKRAVNLKEALQKSLNGHFIRYTGSLSYPPCTAAVRYIVAANPLEASEEQIKHLRRRFPGKGNSRPIQPIEARLIAVDQTALPDDKKLTGEYEDPGPVPEVDKMLKSFSASSYGYCLLLPLAALFLVNDLTCGA